MGLLRDMLLGTLVQRNQILVLRMQIALEVGIVLLGFDLYLVKALLIGLTVT